MPRKEKKNGRTRIVVDDRTKTLEIEKRAEALEKVEQKRNPNFQPGK